jgi:hypothetical protein
MGWLGWRDANVGRAAEGGSERSSLSGTETDARGSRAVDETRGVISRKPRPVKEKSAFREACERAAAATSS